MSVFRNGTFAGRLVRGRDTWALLLLAVWPLVYFWQVTLGQSVWFTTDVVRLFHPFGVELARALNQGRLPLWTPGLLAGFPLLAEGQVGALYPINLILYKLLPPHCAISYGILFHLAWAGIGMFAYTRTLGLRTQSALLGGFVFSFNGVIFGHLSHPSVIATISWLPWLILFQERFQRARVIQNGIARTNRRAVWFALTAITFGVQFLCGSAQLAFLNSLTFVAFGVAGGLMWNRHSQLRATLTGIVFSTFLPGILGAGIAAAQVLPTSELVGYSVRHESSQEFFTSYSLPLESLSQMFLPYHQGEPAETNGEFWFYFGIAPLLLALLAPFLRRSRQTIFFACFALIALSLALGGHNPFYAWLYGLPVFGLFRVPARYLFVFIFATTLMSAIALDELARTRVLNRRTIVLGAGFALGVLAVIALAYTQPLDFWLRAWQFLPLPLVFGSALMIGLGKVRWLDGSIWPSALVGLTFLDLACFMPPFLATIDAVTPAAYVETVPRSVAALGEPQNQERAFTDLSVFPSLPALRGSLFPSSGLAFGWESAQAYTSLEYAKHQKYFYNLAPSMLNLLNVRYFMIPLEPRPRTKTATPTEAVALDILDKEISITSTTVVAMYVASATEQAGNLVDGTLVAQVFLRFDDDTIKVLPLRVGVETADWDHDRKMEIDQIQHQRARIAHSFPAFWRSFGSVFEGYTYLARFDLSVRSSHKIVSVSVRDLLPDARLMIESIWFEENNGESVSMAHLAGKDDFRLAYMSDTVAAWENLDVLPRAFVVHAAEVVNDDTAFARLDGKEFRADQQVLLAEGQPLGPTTIRARDVTEIRDYQPERVELRVTTDQPGYLVLTDSWYPGWNAFVDGRSAPIYRADVLFRAVRIEPGSHAVEFVYQPVSLLWGIAVSLVSLFVIASIAFSVVRHGYRVDGEIR